MLLSSLLSQWEQEVIDPPPTQGVGSLWGLKNLNKKMGTQLTFFPLRVNQKSGGMDSSLGDWMLDFVQFSTDTYSKLPKILWLKTIPIFISQSGGQKSKQAQLRSLVMVSVYQNRGVGQPGPFLGLWGRFHLQDPSGCWQNSDPMTVRLRSQQPCWLSARNYSPLL